MKLDQVLLLYIGQPLIICYFIMKIFGFGINLIVGTRARPGVQIPAKSVSNFFLLCRFELVYLNIKTNYLLSLPKS